MNKILLLIDLQNDYFAGGKFPLWNTEKTLSNILYAMDIAKEKKVPIVHIKHVADPQLGLAPFFNNGTHGVEIHQAILDKSPEAPIVIKTYADSFYKTNLEEILTELGAEELLIVGMMTQNCVTHTAISKSAEKYKVSILTDATTSVNEAIHQIGLAAVMSRPAVSLTTIESALR